MSEDKFYIRYRFFKTFEEGMKYENDFPDLPAEIEFYRKFLQDRLKEIEININVNPEITNRTCFNILRTNMGLSEN